MVLETGTDPEEGGGFLGAPNLHRDKYFKRHYMSANNFVAVESLTVNYTHYLKS